MVCASVCACMCVLQSNSCNVYTCTCIMVLSSILPSTQRIVQEQREVFELASDEDRQCAICNTCCFLSAIRCPCSPGESQWIDESWEGGVTHVQTPAER